MNVFVWECHQKNNYIFCYLNIINISNCICKHINIFMVLCVMRIHVWIRSTQHPSILVEETNEKKNERKDKMKIKRSINNRINLNCAISFTSVLIISFSLSFHRTRYSYFPVLSILFFNRFFISFLFIFRLWVSL